MKTYYFYTLNEDRTPSCEIMDDIEKLETELLNKASKTEDKKLQAWYMHGVGMSHRLKNDRIRNREAFEFQNGQDARYFVRYGVKEIDEEDYNRIVEDDKRIVSRFNEKTLKLMDKFNHRKDGWHFPFKVEAESKGHLKWKLKQMFPEYSEFILKD